ncbi:tudor domain-containing protein [Phthorimaea operculella]|nr:tudor domain-containing protein [Phthorimaea operculella]
MADKEQVIQALRATLISVKGALTIRQANTDYKALLGEPIPYKRLGYATLEKLFLDVPGFKVSQQNGEWYVDAIASQETQHIAAMVSKQKASKKSVKLSHNNRFPLKKQSSWRKPASSANYSYNYNNQYSNQYSNQYYRAKGSTPYYNNNYNNKNSYNSKYSKATDTRPQQPTRNNKPNDTARPGNDINRTTNEPTKQYNEHTEKPPVKSSSPPSQREINTGTEEFKHPASVRTENESTATTGTRPSKKESALQRLSKLRDSLNTIAHDTIPLHLPAANNQQNLPEEVTGTGPVAHVAPAHSLEPPPDSTSSVVKLEWTCRKLGLPQPVYKVHEIRPKRGPPMYDCTCKVNARNYTARLHLVLVKLEWTCRKLGLPQPVYKVHEIRPKRGPPMYDCTCKVNAGNYAARLHLVRGEAGVDVPQAGPAAARLQGARDPTQARPAHVRLHLQGKCEQLYRPTAPRPWEAGVDVPQAGPAAARLQGARDPPQARPAHVRLHLQGKCEQLYRPTAPYPWEAGVDVPQAGPAAARLQGARDPPQARPGKCEELCIQGVGTNYTASSYPDSSPTEDLAKEVVAVKLLATIESSEAGGLPTSSSSKALAYLADLVSEHEAGLWANTVPHLYREKYGENLPSNWQELVENCPRIIKDRVVNGLLVLLPNNEESAPPAYLDMTLVSDDTIDSELPPLQFPEDDFWNVFITVANSTLEIWFRIIGPQYSDAFETLLADMASYYERYGTSVDKSMIINNAWYAVNLEDGGWQRAKILEIEETTATVFLGDHGDDDVVMLDKVKILEPQFRKLPAQAVLCRLEGCEELAAGAAGALLAQRRLPGEVLVAAPGVRADPADPSVAVVLYDTSTQRDLNLNKEIASDFCTAGAFTVTQFSRSFAGGCGSVRHVDAAGPQPEQGDRQRLLHRRRLHRHAGLCTSLAGHCTSLAGLCTSLAGHLLVAVVLYDTSTQRDLNLNKEIASDFCTAGAFTVTQFSRSFAGGCGSVRHVDAAGPQPEQGDRQRLLHRRRLHRHAGLCTSLAGHCTSLAGLCTSLAGHLLVAVALYDTSTQRDLNLNKEIASDFCTAGAFTVTQFSRSFAGGCGSVRHVDAAGPQPEQGDRQRLLHRRRLHRHAGLCTSLAGHCTSLAGLCTSLAGHLLVAVALYDTSTQRDLNLNKEIASDFCTAGAFTVTQKPSEVEVGCVTEEGRVWISRAGGAATVRNALALLTAGPYRRPLPAAPQAPAPNKGTLYIVRTLAGDWVRCTIISELDSEGTVRTQLVDSGLILRAPLSSLVPLASFSPVLNDYPYQAIQVRLGAAEKAAGSMTKRLRELLLEQRVLCRALPGAGGGERGERGGAPHVELFVRTGPQNILASVNNAILMEFEYLTNAQKPRNSEPETDNPVDALNKKKERIFRSSSLNCSILDANVAGSAGGGGGALPAPPLPAPGKCFDVYIAMAANPWNFVLLARLLPAPGKCFDVYIAMAANPWNFVVSERDSASPAAPRSTAARARQVLRRVHRHGRQPVELRGAAKQHASRATSHDGVSTDGVSQTERGRRARQPQQRRPLHRLLRQGQLLVQVGSCMFISKMASLQTECPKLSEADAPASPNNGDLYTVYYDKDNSWYRWVGSCMFISKMASLQTECPKLSEADAPASPNNGDLYTVYYDKDNS